MRYLQTALSLGLLGSIPHGLSILQKRKSNNVLKVDGDENSFVQWGQAYVQLNIEETDSGYTAHVFEHFGSCYMPDVTISPEDSAYRFHAEVQSLEDCHTLCFEDARCMFARLLKEEKVCQLFEYSSTPMGNEDPNSVMINAQCDDACFIKDKQYKGEHLNVQAANDAVHCHNLCIQDIECSLFTYNKLEKQCYFFTGNPTMITGVQHVSGTGEKCDSVTDNLGFSEDSEVCEMPESPEFCVSSCHMNGIIFDVGYGVAPASNAFECHKACHEDDNCWNWSFFDSICHLYNGAQSIRSFYHYRAVSGPKTLCGSQEAPLKSAYSINTTYGKANVILEVVDIDDIGACETVCKHRRHCAGFTLNYEERVCRLHGMEYELPKTEIRYSPTIAATVDAFRLPRCAQYDRMLPESVESEVESTRYSLHQCIAAARLNKDIKGYLWLNGKCHHFKTEVNSEKKRVMTSKPTGVYGTTSACREHHEPPTTCVFPRGITVKANTKRYWSKLGSQENCYKQCQRFPWCIIAIWQHDKHRCHIIDNMTTYHNNNNNSLTPRSCDTSCYDTGFAVAGAQLIETQGGCPSANFCFMLCTARKDCVLWTYEQSSSKCSVYNTRGHLIQNPDATSGGVMACDAPVNPIPDEVRLPVEGFKDLSISENLEVSEEENANACMQRCNENDKCKMITYSNNSNTCYLKDAIPPTGLIASDSENQDITRLKINDLDCYKRGVIKSTVQVLAETKFNTVAECASYCASVPECIGIQYFVNHRVCKLYDVERFREGDEGTEIVDRVIQCA